MLACDIPKVVVQMPRGIVLIPAVDNYSSADFKELKLNNGSILALHHNRTLIWSHSLPVRCNPRFAGPVTASATNHI